LVGIDPHGGGAYWLSLAFTFGGAALFTFARKQRNHIPLEALGGGVRLNDVLLQWAAGLTLLCRFGGEDDSGQKRADKEQRQDAENRRQGIHAA